MELLKEFYRIMDLIQAEHDKPRPHVPPAPLTDPDKELRDEVQSVLRCRGVLESQVLPRTQGDKLLIEAERLGLL